MTCQNDPLSQLTFIYLTGKISPCKVAAGVFIKNKGTTGRE